MNDFLETLIIRDNTLTDDLRRRSLNLIEKIKQLPLNERRTHYDELHTLLDEILKNKNQNFNSTLRKLKESPFVNQIQIANVPDEETEDIIRKIFEVLTNHIEK